jgi:hypothetical protein
LKRQFAGKVSPQELQILVWDIKDLKDFCVRFGNNPV